MRAIIFVLAVLFGTSFSQASTTESVATTPEVDTSNIKKFEVRINPVRNAFMDWNILDAAYRINEHWAAGLIGQYWTSYSGVGSSAVGVQVQWKPIGEVFADGWYMTGRVQQWSGEKSPKGFGFLAFSPFEDERNFVGYTAEGQVGRQWVWEYFTLSWTGGATKAWLLSADENTYRSINTQERYSNMVLSVNTEIKIGLVF